MITKKFLKHVSVLSAVVGITAPALAVEHLYDFDETAYLSVFCTASVKFDDNIYLNRTSEEKAGDLIWSITPGIELFKGGTESNFKFSVSEQFSVYTVRPHNNSQSTHVSAAYNFTGSKLNATVAAGFDQISSTSNREKAHDGKLVRSHNIYARAIGEYSITEKVSVMSGFKWVSKTYDNYRDSYNDRETYSIPVSLYHSVVTEKVKAGISYEYRYVDLRSCAASTYPGYQQVHFIGVTAKGDFTDALTLNGRIGYTSSEYFRRGSGNYSNETLGLGLSATYKISEKTNVVVSASRDFEISGDGSGIVSTGAMIRLNHTLNEHWSGHTSISYRRDDYERSSRADDTYTYSLGVSYKVNSHWAVSATYRFQWNDSNRSSSEYTDNSVTLALHFRY